MILQLTPAEWAAIEAAGSGVLFRAAEYVEPHPKKGTVPPAEFVEAAQVCETCAGKAKVPGAHHGPADLLFACPDCLDGKRWVAAVVPCDCHGDGECDRCRPSPHPATGHDDYTHGTVTVGHVIVTWGPHPVRSFSDPHHDDGHPHVCIDGSDAVLIRVADDPSITLPPDVDPQSLVGQYALGVEVVA